MEYKTIRFELKENGIGFLTLNRPEQLNAISFKMCEELHHLLGSLFTNLDCRVIILKAEGRGFCAGLDLKESVIFASNKKPKDLTESYVYLKSKENSKNRMYFQDYISKIFKKMRHISQPIIAAIQGPASGGGFAFCMASDIRIATKDAKFNNAFIKLGLTGADVGTSYFLPRLVGLSRATEILFTGRFINAKEAEEIGFVYKVVDAQDLISESVEIAKNLLNKSPLGLRMTKQALTLSLDSPSLELITQLENLGQDISGTSKDVSEGVSAFLGKREPKFSSM